jgi:hypothetical protein
LAVIMRCRVSLFASLLVAGACGEASSAPDAADAALTRDAAPLADAGVTDAARDGDALSQPDAHAVEDAGLDAGLDMDASAALDDAVSHYGLDWLNGIDGGFVPRASTEITADVETVWRLVRDVNGYARWCSVLSADAGSVAPGQPIHLAIQLLDPPFGPTESDEQIVVVDDARHAIAWERDFGDGQKTLRYQLVEPSDGGVRYTTALRFPPELGGLVEPFLGANLTRAFGTIAADLKRASE